ncbi:MAG: HNH endonuclease [Bifidobacteriaceae bacterium]|nr:HNH endonuclease [Bifidobacteriaceae bacterium]
MDALVAVVDQDPGGGAPLRVGRPARFVLAVTANESTSGGVEGILEETGEPLAPSAVDQAACDSEWVAVLVGSFGQPLDVGRVSRRFPESIRLALARRDLGCVFPGRGMPPSACQAHHLQKWASGGPTALRNSALCRPPHHRLVEPARVLPDGTPWYPGCDDPGRWRVEIDPVHHHPVVIPPARVDPERKPLLNDRIRQKLETFGAPPRTDSEPPPPDD